MKNTVVSSGDTVFALGHVVEPGECLTAAGESASLALLLPSLEEKELRQ